MPRGAIGLCAVFSSVLLLGCAGLRTSNTSPVEIRDFDSWDANDDGFLGNYEWDSGFAESGIFNVWDRNSDLKLDQEEWTTGPVNWDVEGVGYWYDWDWNDDYRIDSRELGNALFEAWDDDDNVQIDSNEFEAGVDTL